MRIMYQNFTEQESDKKQRMKEFLNLTPEYREYLRKYVQIKK
jgi:hypothetical protein